MNLEEAIFYSKLIIKNGDYYAGKRFRNFSKSYIGTTEDISFYLEKEIFKKGKALTVLAGGDHIFNLVFRNVKEIDAFDINILEYFVFYLRKAMINCLSYEDFIKANALFFSVYLDEIREILEKIKPYLKEDVYEYYRKILEFAMKKGRLENLYYIVIGDTWKKDNSYLVNEEAYLSLKEKMVNTKINLLFGDAKDIANNLNESYDIILLSNICDYLGSEQKNLAIEDFNNFINLFYNLLSDNGILINYLYGFKDRFLIKNSAITRKDISNSNLVRIGDTNQGYYRVRKIF